jgi:hypothetical protein
MEAKLKVISRSAARVYRQPEIPQTIQVVIQAVKANGKKLSITKHLRYQGGQYVGRAYDYRKRQFTEIVFPLDILSGGLKENVRLAA